MYALTRELCLVVILVVSSDESPTDPLCFCTMVTLNQARSSETVGLRSFLEGANSRVPNFHQNFESSSRSSLECVQES
jgi:hypothetical protein